MRNNVWLKTQLDFLFKNYFSDVKITSLVEIRFGREAKYRFGSIKLYRNKKQETRNKKPTWKVSSFKFQVSSLAKRVPQKSLITITSMFAKEDVPVKVVQYTIAHELCHWAHGFSSANRRLFKYPHHGGIVNKELNDRGAGDLIVAFKKWLKIYRQQILKSRITV